MTALQKAIAAVAGSLAGLLAVAVIVMAIWNLGWFAADQGAKQQGKLNSIQAQSNQQGYTNQYGMQQQFDNDMNQLATDKQEIDGSPLTGPAATGTQLRDIIVSQIRTGNDACSQGSQLDSSYLGTRATWVHDNCTGSTLSATSPLRR